MKFKNLNKDFNNLFGLVFIDEKKAKSELKNFAISKMNSFQSEKEGAALIYDVLDFVRDNFTFNVQNELLEIKDSFLKKHYTELMSFLSSSNFGKVTYGDKELYFICKDIFEIFWFINKDIERDTDVLKNLDVSDYTTRFRLNKKNYPKDMLEHFPKLYEIFYKRNLELKKFNFVEKVTNCGLKTAKYSYFLEYRDTAEVRELESERKAIFDYFKLNEPDFSKFEQFLRKEEFREEEIVYIINYMSQLLLYSLR